MRVILAAAIVALCATAPLALAGAWMHADPGGGCAHSGSAGGFEHGTAASSQGVAHAGDYGGYHHATVAGPDGAGHAGAWGTTTTAVNGAYHHWPAAVANYGANCYNCGSPGWGTALASG
jgi:hypothetical protein